MGKQNKKQIPLDQLPIATRFASTRYDPEDCEDAIHGRKLPKTFGDPIHRLCIIRGIRHHHGFAQDVRGLTPEFTRALNARDIMSNVIPTMSGPDEVPYCIWHPDVPSEDTLRALVQQYPDMLYHAARSCAVAGYAELYKELDPLPEVHVAEEAGYAGIQRNSKGSQEIYQYILSQPAKFEIMNDYNRTVDIPGRRIAPLNGDTAVCSSLEARSKYFSPKENHSILYKKPWGKSFYNITEDWGMDDHDCDAPKPSEDDFPLVYSPLPADLPLINKDNLICVAAYMGDIDRYARLRRPAWVGPEHSLVIRGIYHNAFFAKWWSTQIPEEPERSVVSRIRCAINARRIMSNDLSWVSASTPHWLLPEVFWYPDFASQRTYEKLAHLQPERYLECLQACIAAGYQAGWDSLLNEPPENVYAFQSPRRPDEPKDPKLFRISRIAVPRMLNEAQRVWNQHFLRELTAALQGKPEAWERGDHWYDWATAHDMYHPEPDGLVDIDNPVRPSCCWGPYDGDGATLGDADYAVFVMDAVDKTVWEEEKKRQKSSVVTPKQIYELIMRLKK